MRLRTLRLPVIIGGLLLLSVSLFAQKTPLAKTNSTTITLGCNQPCTDITIQVPHLKETTDYTLVSVPYNPFPYNTPTGTEDFTLYNDDRYSSLFNLPFSFCFYGATYTSAVVGSNGLITFDPANASCDNGYVIGTTIPYAGGVPCQQGTMYYPKASIMGAYSDLDPTNAASGPDRKIQWEVTGTAPNRRFVVSYYHIGVFGRSSGACPAPANTFQIVVHESTGVIDVFFQQKGCASTTNNGRAIMGIQNWTQNRAVSDVRHNNAVWNESNSGYSFVPSGNASRYISTGIYTLGGTLVAIGDSTTTVTGLLDLTFHNICPPSNNNVYIVKTSFTSCTDPLAVFQTEDTVYVNRSTDLNATATTTNTGCGAPSGTITVTVPPGGVSPYTFSLDGAPPITSPSPYTFNGINVGVHYIIVTDANGVCNSTVYASVNSNNTLTAAVASTATGCAAVSNGTITITPAGGSIPYTYILDGGAPQSGGSPYTFNNVPAGPHTVLVSDASGCASTPIDITIATGPGVTGGISSTATSCPAALNGTITINLSTGILPCTYQLDAGVPQSSGNSYTFNNVSPGPHSVTVTDNVGCTLLFPVNVTAGPDIAASVNSTSTSCSGASNGSIVVTPTNGLAPYTFKLDAAAPVVGTIPYTFTNVPAGSHSIQFFDASGCISAIYPVTVAAGAALTTTASETDVLCKSGSTGSITVATPTIGTAPYQYSLDGVSWQAGNIFNGLAAGNYTVYFRESAGCQGTLSITVNEPAQLSAAAAMTPVVCKGQPNGIIVITPGGGVTPYQYSIDGGVTWQAGSNFNVPAGTYTITIKDANNCVTTQTITVTEPATLTANAVTSNASCNGGNDGTITLSPAGGNSSYQYSLDAVNFQSSNVFNVAPGAYTVTIKDALGCSVTKNVVVGLTNNLSVTPPADPTICEGNSVSLQLNSNATQYAWTPVTGLSNPAIASPVANPVVTTQYTATATLGRCSANATVIVHVNTAPLPNAGTKGDICYGQSYQLQGSGGTAFTWTPSTYLDNSHIANPLSTPAITTTYVLSVMDANGCNSLVTDQVTVNVTPPIHVSTFPYDTLAYTGDQFTILATSAASIYNWTPASGLSDPNIANPIVTVGAIGGDITYRVVASTPAGCKGEGSVTIHPYKGPDFYVPSAFTPNNDGRNDRFIPIPIGIKQLNYFKVYNRWGKMVYSTTALNEGWDGRLGGAEQDPAVYVWILQGITRDGRVISKKGTVVLIR